MGQQRRTLPVQPVEARTFTPGEIVHRTAGQAADDPYRFVMASDSVDRMGDIVEIDGIDLKAFSANPIALWGHDFAQPIGTWQNVRKAAGQLIGDLVLAAKGTSAKVDELRGFIEQRILKTVSVGFRVIEAAEIAGTWGLRFTKSELLECSLVPIPANADAQRIKALVPGAPDYLFSRGQSPTDRSERIRAAAASPRRELAPVQKDGPKMARTIAEKITTFLARSATIDDELNTIQEGADNDNGRDFSEDENARLEALTGEKLAVVKNIEILQATEAALAAKAQPAGNLARPLVLPAAAAKNEPPGTMLAKVATAGVLAFCGRVPIETVIAREYASDARVAEVTHYMQRAAVGAADTTTPGWAAELVATEVAAFMDIAAAKSVFQALRNRPSTLDLSLDGVGKISIPMRTNRGNLGGAWVGEAGVIPVLQGTLTAALVEPTKLAGITTFTNELMNSTSGQIESILRQAMADDTSMMLDKALLDNVVKVAGVRPSGLRVNSTQIASGGANAVNADLMAALAPIIAAGGGDDIVIIMNPAQVTGLALAKNALGMLEYPEVAQGQLNRYPIIESKNVPAGLVFVMDAAYFVDALGVPEIKVSDQATLTMANADGTAPTQAIDAAGAIGTAGQVIPDGGIHVAGAPAGAGTAGAVAMSLFQQNLMALRLILPVSWVMRQTLMVSVITGVAWSSLSAGGTIDEGTGGTPAPTAKESRKSEKDE